MGDFEDAKGVSFRSAVSFMNPDVKRFLAKRSLISDPGKKTTWLERVFRKEGST